MDLSVSTPTPAFLNDILDEVRVFYGREVRLVSDAPVRLSHEESLAGGIRRVRAALSFASGGEYAFETSAPEGTGALEDKRVHKRLIKTCVYRVFRQASGVRPPWGSLTGIRPTRLIWAAMAEGKTLEQAEKDLHDVFDVTEEKCRLTAETVRVGELKDQPIVVPLRWKAVFEGYCRQAGFAPYLVSVSDSVVRDVLSVRAGLGMALLPSSAKSLMGDDGALVVKRLVEPEILTHTVVSWLKNRTLSAGAQHFLELLREMYREKIGEKGRKE